MRFINSRPVTLAVIAVLLAVVCGQNTTTSTTTTTTTTTTTPKPETTTPNSTTTTTTTTTTPAPAPKTTTTPAPAPITTTTPTPAPAPQQIEGNVTNGNHTCIRYQFSSIELHILYPTVDKKNETAVVPFPYGSSLKYFDNACMEKIQSFNLTFVDNANHSVILAFGFSSGSSSVLLEYLNATFTYSAQFFPNITTDLIGKRVQMNLIEATPNFNVEKSHSYSCAHVTVPKTEAGPFHVLFSGLRIQAFMDEEKNGQFSSEHNCQSEINDVVPIAVGAALTGLVIIVMIAYFIGRRRSRRLAYQSV